MRVPRESLPLGMRVQVLDQWGNRTREGLDDPTAGRNVMKVELIGLGFTIESDGLRKDIRVDDTDTLNLETLVVRRRPDRKVELQVRLAHAPDRPPLLTIKGKLRECELALMHWRPDGGR